MAKNPLIIGAVSLLPNLISAISSIIKDKKVQKEETKSEATTTGEVILNSVKEITDGSISSKRVLNIGGTGLIIMLAYNDISTHGITKQNICLIGIGVVYSLGMSLVTYLSEHK